MAVDRAAGRLSLGLKPSYFADLSEGEEGEEGEAGAGPDFDAEVEAALASEVGGQRPASQWAANNRPVSCGCVLALSVGRALWAWWPSSQPVHGRWCSGGAERCWVGREHARGGGARPGARARLSSAPAAPRPPQDEELGREMGGSDSEGGSESEGEDGAEPMEEEGSEGAEPFDLDDEIGAAAGGGEEVFDDASGSGESGSESEDD